MDRVLSPTIASAPISSTSTSSLVILGGGPAGAIAALTALREGSPVSLIERATFPKHKVCGEFLSPEIVPVLESAGVLERFLDARPWLVRTMSVSIGSREKRARLPEPAYGLSRFTYDNMLWSEAMGRGAVAVETGTPNVITSGRPAGTTGKGMRLFGFKAHFEGPADDAVQLYFLRNAYVGINCIEEGRTNVCGLAPEAMLKEVGFEPEALFATSPPLHDRLKPLQRNMRWLFTGPLEFRQQWKETTTYRAGDALSFVDPFTGSGLLCAAVTGSLAGLHAARKVSVEAHLQSCRQAIGKPFLFSSVLRSLAGTDWAERLIGFVPGQLLYRLTRPQARLSAIKPAFSGFLR
ncbi:MAG: tryptophan 7-halogenase [Bryobacteraceae bacterium]|nr:tryptophan 7-halogenase [Bryobacteraceae bacterium]